MKLIYSSFDFSFLQQSSLMYSFTRYIFQIETICNVWETWQAFSYPRFHVCDQKVCLYQLKTHDSQIDQQQSKCFTEMANTYSPTVFALGVYEDTRFVTSLGRHHLSFMTESELRTAHASVMSGNGYAGGLRHLDTLEYMTAKVLCMIAKSIVLSRLHQEIQMEVKKVMLAITRYNIYFDVGFFNISVSQTSVRKVMVEVWQRTL